LCLCGVGQGEAQLSQKLEEKLSLTSQTTLH
jgi:hypothetical protein